MTISSVNPATGEELIRLRAATPGDVDCALARANSASEIWRRTSLSERAHKVLKVGEVLRSRKEELARIATLEMGKVITQSRAEVEKAAANCDYYFDHAEELLAPEKLKGGQLENWVHYEPLGTVLAVMPWNFPFGQVFRFAPAMLLAGNTVLLKHASNVPQCSLLIQEVFEEAGLPTGVFQALLVGSQAVEGILSDERVQGVTLTGSELAGISVAAIAGRELKKSVMELGGSDAFIVLDDVDVRAVAAAATQARFHNCGQACTNAKRFIVLESVADEFERALVDEVMRLRIGDPLDPRTQLGPMASKEFTSELKEQVEHSIAAGAELLTGGFREEGSAYVDPIVLTGVTREMRVFREETFGPAAAVIRASDEAAAIELANDSRYGLGASIWTADIERGRSVAARVDAGMVFVNSVVASDARLPFGGMKRSGYGRELGVWGIREFTEVKSVALSSPAQ